MLLTRALFALPFFLGALYFLAVGAQASVYAILPGIALMLVGAVILAPGISEVLAFRAGSLMYPEEQFDRPPPAYGPAEGMVKKGLYQEAMQAYQEIAAEHPTEVKPFLAMIDMAAYRMENLALADRLYQQGCDQLTDPKAVELLQRLYTDIRARGEHGREAGRRVIHLPTRDAPEEETPDDD